MNNLYETGGVPPLPFYMQDRIIKCPLCGRCFVGALFGTHVCADTMEVEHDTLPLHKPD